MPGKTIKIRSTEGGEFDCYLAMPAGRRPGPGRGAGLRGARRRCRTSASSPRNSPAHGFIAAAPDLFWRTVPGPLGHDDKRTQPRSQPRLEKIKTGERDLVDTLAQLQDAAAVQRPRRDHGLLLRRALRHPRAEAARLRRRHLVPRQPDAATTSSELDGVTQPVCIIWGDQDHRAPPEMLDAYRPVPARMKNVEVHIFPGILHGYMMPGSPKAYDSKTRDFSMKRALAILDGLRGGGAALRKAS